MYKSYIKIYILWYLHVIETFVKAKYCCDKCLLTCFCTQEYYVSSQFGSKVGILYMLRLAMNYYGMHANRSNPTLQGTNAVYCIQSCFLEVNTHLYLTLVASQPMFFQYEAFDIPSWSQYVPSFGIKKDGPIWSWCIGKY